MLTATGAARHLLRAGLLDPAEAVDGALVLRDASRRNQSFRVERDRGRSYFLKHAPAAEEPGLLGNEARICARLTVAEGAIAGRVPRVVAHEGRMLVLELIPGATDLRALHARDAAPDAEVGAALGSALAALHRTPAEDAGLAEPWILWGHRPTPAALRDMSLAGRELAGIVHDSGLRARLEELRRGWRTDALIHADLSWDNLLTGPPPRPGGPPSVTIVDWELAGRGDPAWDAGAVVAGSLSAWLFSIRGRGETRPEALAEGAKVPLDAVLPGIHAFWRTYADELDLSGEVRRDALVRATRFAGGRLVQTAFEAAQTVQRLSGGAILHLQVAANVLDRPDRAASDLLALSEV